MVSEVSAQAPGKAFTASRKLRVLAVTFFFFSGAAGLVYEVAWMRMLSTFLGCTTYSVTAVLTAFMGGLALGSFLAGRYSGRVKDPVRVYGYLEIGVGLAAILAAVLMAASRPVMKLFYDSLAGSPYIFFLVKFVFVVIVLGVPTTLMGATLPVLSKFFVRAMGEVGAQVGKLYGINTLGAFVGAGAAGFLLLGNIGTNLTVAAAVVINLSIGAGALLAARKNAAGPALDAKTSAARPKKEPSRRKKLFLRLLLAAFGVSGFSAMAYQVAWTRVFELFIGSSTYAFTIILLAYLAGLALGSLVAGRLLDRFRPGVLVFVILEIVIALAAVLAIPAAGKAIPLMFIKVLASHRDSFTTIIVFEFLIIFMVLIIPTLAMGALFPVVTKLAAGRVSEIGGTVGRVYAANTTGTILGSAIAGLVLIPLMGTQKTLVFAVAANLLAAGLMLTWLLDRRIVQAAVGFVVEIAVIVVVLAIGAGTQWDRYLMQSAPYIYADRYTKYYGIDARKHIDAMRGSVEAGRIDPDETAAHRDGLYTLLTDEDNPNYGSRDEIKALVRKFWKIVSTPGELDRAGALAVLDELESWFRADYSELVSGHIKLLGEPVYREEGPYLLAVVRKNKWGNPNLSINGKVDASTNGPDMRTQVLFGHVASVYKPRAKTALVVGLGSGVTLGSLALHDYKGVDALEISPAVVNAARFFKDYNHNALANPKVRVIAEDARSFIALTDRKYDVINSIPSNPWMSGVSHLFTIEFFRDCAARLEREGVMAQWVQRYCLTEKDFKMVFATFHEVFPHVHVWASSVQNDFLLVGSKEPLDLTLKGIKGLLDTGNYREDLARINLRTVPVIASMFVMGTKRLEKFTAGSMLNADDRNILEFDAPKNIFLVPDSAFANIAEYREDPAGFIGDAGKTGEEITRAFEAKTQSIRAITRIVKGNEAADQAMMKMGLIALHDVLAGYPDEEMAAAYVNRIDFRNGLAAQVGAREQIWKLYDAGDLVGEKGFDGAKENLLNVKKYVENAKADFKAVLARNPSDGRAKVEMEHTENLDKMIGALFTRASAEVDVKTVTEALEAGDKRKAQKFIALAEARLADERELIDFLLEREPENRIFQLEKKVINFIRGEQIGRLKKILERMR